jgi:hypothetical protein
MRRRRRMDTSWQLELNYSNNQNVMETVTCILTVEKHLNGAKSHHRKYEPEQSRPYTLDCPFRLTGQAFGNLLAWVQLISQHSNNQSRRRCIAHGAGIRQHANSFVPVLRLWMLG